LLQVSLPSKHGRCSQNFGEIFPVDMKGNLNSFICGEVGAGDGDDADGDGDGDGSPNPIYSAHQIRNSRCLILKYYRL